MNPDLAEEIEYMQELMAKSGFFNNDEILEILQDQFIEEDIDFSKYITYSYTSDNMNFNKLEKIFKQLACENIVTVHNCGYDIKEGVEDVFELYVHLKNNGYDPFGFCFYTFEDIEEAIFDKKLKITFGDFEKNELKALEIGKIVFKFLKKEFTAIWNENINEQIEINPFIWDKAFNENIDYEIEGAYEVFTSKVKK